ncbi:hypothetical protein F9C07_2219715 [Aspergillus flavus]|uniref:Uncharacterized protein n=1 Tax=Aspergillus flavus (strain ATCC 200026 / FGSC A1120 / IAM 13836 / NRRL 3357 / JCM 12722 / SRRC 167) TaxID=332952 RepID=A0A7U2MWN0_ASPFN|nr:hypothetical protein F9C07_2219715 [Aspergillus flavus]
MLWFHAACYNVLKSSYVPSKKPTFEDLGRFADATRPTYNSYTKDTIHDSFSQSLFAIMICELITPCWYLIVLGETRRLIELLRNSNCIPQIIYHGTSYLTRLSDKPLESMGGSYQCHIKLPSDINKIIVSFDSIGVHGIQFLEHSSNPISDGSPWYEIFDMKDSSRDLRVQLLSRDLSSKYRVWSSPFPPTIHSWNFYRHPWNFEHAQDKPRLDYVKFDSYTQGHIVCCANARTIGIHGFSGISTMFREFVDSMYRKSRKGHIQWIYCPFNRYEYLEGAWVRMSKVHRGPTPCPIVVYYSLVRDGDGPISGIFHNGLDLASNFISELGVPCSDRYHTKTPEPPLDTYLKPPVVPPDRGSPACTWYMTKAPLKGLIKAQVCRDKEQLHSPCIGLLLFYSDQHIESLGQPTYVEKDVIDGRRYIKDIWSDINYSRLNVQRLPEDDIIVWWLSKFDDSITTYYN